VWFLVFVGIVTALGGGAGLAALLLVASQRRKNRAESTKSNADGAQAISNAAVGLIKPLEDRIERAEAEVRTLRTRLNRADKRLGEQSEEITNLRTDNKSLRALVRRMAAVATGATALVDPAGTVLALRDLLADSPHHTAE
jgi:uncharacterized protein HemX